MAAKPIERFVKKQRLIAARIKRLEAAGRLQTGLGRALIATLKTQLRRSPHGE